VIEVVENIGKKTFKKPKPKMDHDHLSSHSEESASGYIISIRRNFQRQQHSDHHT
jgi:hypothetical protein